MQGCVGRRGPAVPGGQMNIWKSAVMGIVGGISIFLGTVYSIRHDLPIFPSSVYVGLFTLVVMWMVEIVWDRVAERRKE